MFDLRLSNDNTFVNILNGEALGKIIEQDEAKRFAIIESLHPEAAVHWLAITHEPIESIEELEAKDRERCMDLIEFAISTAKAKAPDYPELQRGFTIKFHFGSFESIPHAKLHILSLE